MSMSRRWRQILRLLILAACVAALAWAISTLGPRRVLRAALQADPLWLALSALPVAGRFFIWAFKWQRMLAREAPVRYAVCLRLLAAGSFANLATPTAKLAGGVVRGLFLHRREGWRMATAYGWAMADQVTNVLGHLLLYGLLAPAAVFALPPGRTRLAILISGGLVLAGLAAAAALRGWGWRLLVHPRIGRRLTRWLPEKWRGEDVIEEVLRPLLREGTFVPDLAWAAVAFSSVCLANALVLRALGVDTPILLLSVAVVLAYFAGVAAGTWGGIGVTEAALTGLYVQFGVPADLALAGTLLHRAVFYLVVLGWGGAALLAETRWHAARQVDRRT